MQEEQTALARVSNTARDIPFDSVRWKRTALGLCRIHRRKKIPLLPILKKNKYLNKMITGLFQETEKHT